MNFTNTVLMRVREAMKAWRSILAGRTGRPPCPLQTKAFRIKSGRRSTAALPVVGNTGAKNGFDGVSPYLADRTVSPSPLKTLRLCVSAVAFLFLAFSVQAEIVPPGFKPPSPGLHAIVGAKVIVKPGEVLEKANIVIRDGKIESVGTNTPPSGARVWDGAGTWVYPAFVESNWQVDGAGGAQNGDEEDQGLTSGARFYGVTGAEKGTSPAASWQNSPGVNPQHRMALNYKGGAKLVEPLRSLGFATAVAAPAKGIFRGSSTLVLLNNEPPSKATLRAEVFQHLAWQPLSGKDKGYPHSLMGVIALTRQTFMDAEFQARSKAGAQSDPSLAALGESVAGRQTVMIEPGSVLMLDRAAKTAAELRLDYLLIATGQEWRRPELIAATKARLIVPLEFPEIPKMPEEDDWETVTLDLLRAWDWAPENPALLRSNGLKFALSTTQLADKKEFRKRLKKALERGLTQDDALAALTTIPAEFVGASTQLGTIEPGKLANLLVVAGGSYFEPTNEVREVWVAGEVFRQQIEPPKPPKKEAAKEEKKKEEKPKKDDTKRIAHAPSESRGPAAGSKTVLIRNGTVWTSASQGILTNTDLLVENGRIKSIGPNLPAPDGALVVEAKGRHVTPGLIDCHNHSFVVGAVNEGTLPSSAMVRIADVINSETRNIADELAGGLTTANVLHGSANPIGGQNCVVKLRDGASPDEMKFAGAPSGIKFALGENVKQSNWGDNETTRFPQTRMGVRTFFDNRFSAAKEYQQKRKADPAATRRDLELDALVEILEGARLIHCHSYRQDEILALLRLMEGYKIRIGTLQHILEGYKVADEIARHGAGASAFSDWWAYKYEVMDAIPYAGSLMRERGVTVSFNSDSSDLARRLNFEAAKAVKYGGTSEEEALKFVTINPAKQLGIDKQVGSLEVGKDADFAIWSGHPLDSASSCLETWIDGARYFEREQALQRAAKLQEERAALLKKAKDASGDGGGDAGGDKGAAFFRVALELLNEGKERHCEDLN